MENEELSQELQTIIEEAKRKAEELDQEYQKFASLRTELSNKAQGVRTFYSNSENKSNEVNQIVDDIQNKNKEIENIKVSIAGINQEINDYHQKFIEIKSKLDSEEDGLEVNLEWIKNKKEESNKKYEEIVKNQLSSEEIVGQIKDYKNQIEEIKNESEEFKSSIGETLDLITASSLHNAFNNRKKEIKKDLDFWKFFLLGSLSVLLVAILIIYDRQAKNGGFTDWSHWYRYLFTTPVIYLVYLSSKNYNLERDLLERYSFKAVLSTSLRSYIKLLRDYFPNKEQELLDFTLESTGKIYCEPFVNKDKKRKYGFGVNKFFNINFEEDEKTKELEDEIKKTIFKNKTRNNQKESESKSNQ